RSSKPCRQSWATESHSTATRSTRRDDAAQELELPGIAFACQGGQVGIESVNPLGIDRDLGLVAGCSPALGHEERIVDQAVHGADREQGGRHVAETGVERRDVSVAPLLESRAGE